MTFVCVVEVEDWCWKIGVDGLDHECVHNGLGKHHCFDVFGVVYGGGVANPVSGLHL